MLVRITTRISLIEFSDLIWYFLLLPQLTIIFNFAFNYVYYLLDQWGPQKFFDGVM